MIGDLLAVVLAGAAAAVGLDGELAFALGALRHVAFERDAFAHGLERVAGGDHFAAVGGFVTDADDGAALFVFHERLSVQAGRDVLCPETGIRGGVFFAVPVFHFSFVAIGILVAFKSKRRFRPTHWRVS